jgi:anti-sigma regulatory factor (Ser/Thr protein kinase)
MESISLAPTVGDVATARRFVQRLLADRGLDTDIAELLTTELVTNVVRHAKTGFAVLVDFDPCVRVEVHDGVAATDAFREILQAAPLQMPLDAISGRGLSLLRSLASRFGLTDELGVHNGKIVWFELDGADLVIVADA